jgi:hypothetical protein
MIWVKHPLSIEEKRIKCWGFKITIKIKNIYLLSNNGLDFFLDK